MFLSSARCAALAACSLGRVFSLDEEDTLLQAARMRKGIGSEASHTVGYVAVQMQVRSSDFRYKEVLKVVNMQTYKKGLSSDVLLSEEAVAASCSANPECEGYLLIDATGKFRPFKKGKRTFKSKNAVNSQGLFEWVKVKDIGCEYTDVAEMQDVDALKDRLVDTVNEIAAKKACNAHLECRGYMFSYSTGRYYPLMPGLKTYSEEGIKAKCVESASDDSGDSDSSNSGEIDLGAAGKSASGNSGESDAGNSEGISPSPTCVSHSCQGGNVKRHGVADLLQPDEQKCCLPKQRYNYITGSVMDVSMRGGVQVNTESSAVSLCNGWAWCKGFVHDYDPWSPAGDVFGFLQRGENTYRPYQFGSDWWVKRKVTTCDSFWPSECPDNSDCIGLNGVCVAPVCRDTLKDYMPEYGDELCSWASNDKYLCDYRPHYAEQYELYDDQDFNTNNFCCGCGGGEKEAKSCDDVVCSGRWKQLETLPPLPPYYTTTCCTLA